MKRFVLFSVTAAYLAALLWAYATIISPSFAYYGYQLIWPGPWEMAWLVALALLPLGFLPLGLSRPSGLIVWWLYMTVYIPSVLMPAISLTLGFLRLLPLQLALLVCMAMLSAASGATVLALPSLRVHGKTFWPVVLFLWGSALIFVSIHFNVSTLVANLASLFFGGSEYTIRNGFLEQLSQAGRLLGYTTGQIGEALDPFFIACGLVYRKKWLLVVGIVGQLMIFSVLGSKSILFSTLFIVVVYFMMQRYRQSFGVALAGLLIGVVLLSAAADRLTNGIFLSSITTRRTLLDPGLLTGFYFEHYSHRAHAGLAYHFPSNGQNIPAPSYEIGLVYFGDQHIDANCNLWAEGFADFGLPGMAGFTLLLCLMMWSFDSVAARRDPRMAMLLVAMQAFALSNSAPMTVVFTHGGVASALLLWASPATEAVAPGASEDDMQSDGEPDEPAYENAYGVGRLGPQWAKG